MADIETTIEKKLIDQLTLGDSQWTNAPNLKTEDDLWRNFREILEENNKDRLDGEPLTADEFGQVRNAIVSSSFYESGRKLVGENGVFHVNITRRGQTVPLVVFSRYQKAGGSSRYQIINQYRALKDDDQDEGKSHNRRYDVTFLFNGLPLIHMELKNGRNASYLEAFNQIQKYINEGHFKGIFSMVQMFVVSNGVQTKYIAADEVLNSKFLTSWTEHDNPDKPVAGVFDFASHVLRIPEAHEMVTDYCQLDAEKHRLMLLRPYQIQAIHSIRDACSAQRSGYIWHTTGSGKTLTSYKVARNLLFDIPSLDKTIFLIDRRDLDDKTCDDFRSYAANDVIDVQGTEHFEELKTRLTSPKRQMIVTTIQKMQHLGRWCKDNPDNPKCVKIMSKKVAFVVDECHRTVTKQTQVILKGMFRNSLWYGFTGTPIFDQNKGSLSATTKELYGDVLHSYTIKNALHDEAVLGFQVERLGHDGIIQDLSGYDIGENLAYYDTDEHILSVIDVVVNHSVEKFALHNGPGKTYEAIITTGSIKKAQRYYDLFQKVKRGETRVVIRKDIRDRYPDFPKVAITYSERENQDDSVANNAKLRDAVKDYDDMFGTTFHEARDFETYNENLTRRFARKEPAYAARSAQLDVVIVADRLLTGFDAPCLSTVFIDRQPMSYHTMIQAFSRTNRLFDKNKTTGYIVTFQSPGRYKVDIDQAIELFSNGGTSDVLAPPFTEAEVNFREAILKLRILAPTPDDCAAFGPDVRKKTEFCIAYQKFDRCYKAIKGYLEWNDRDLKRDYGITQDEINDYIAWYRNFMDERSGGDGGDGGDDGPVIVDTNYELFSYGRENIDYNYILRLMQQFTLNSGDVKKEDIDKLIDMMHEQSPRVGDELRKLWVEVEKNPASYRSVDLVVQFEHIKEAAIENVLRAFCERYCLDYDDVRYGTTQYHGEGMECFNSIITPHRAKEYNAVTGKKMLPFLYIKQVTDELKTTLDEDVMPFLVE